MKYSIFVKILAVLLCAASLLGVLGGAAGALLAVDESRGLSMVYAQHLLNAPNQGLRGQMVRTFLAELEGLDYLIPDPVDPQKYNLTY